MKGQFEQLEPPFQKIKQKNTMSNKLIIDGKGHVIGREVNGLMLDGKGKLVARYIASSNLTADGKGHNVGRGDQRLRQLGK